MLLLTLLPLTRRTNNNWLFKNKTPLQESKGMGVRLEHLSVQQRPKQMVLEGLEEQVHIDHIVPSPGQHSTCGEVPLETLAPPVGKRIQKGQSAFLPALQLALWESLLWSHPGLQGICGAQHWKSDHDGERRGIQQPVYGSWQTKLIPAVPK